MWGRNYVIAHYIAILYDGKKWANHTFVILSSHSMYEEIHYHYININAYACFTMAGNSFTTFVFATTDFEFETLRGGLAW